MSAEEDHEVIKPPNTLNSKVSYSPDGVDLDTLERAEQVIASLQADYLDWVEQDLAKIQEFLSRAVADAGERKAMMGEIFRVAHDIKGQGGSFGYDLMTAIGNQLCRFVERKKDVAPSDLEVVRLHVDAMRLVIAKRMEGDGGPEGAELVEGLRAVVEKNLGA